jgi:ATP/maltotriose-dependent transcriptional regulator MalT
MLDRFAMAQPAEQLVGRAAELGVIDSSLAELERRSFGALEFRGEPGMGKTRLLSELARRGDELGHIVLSGSAAEFETDLAFWVFVDALDEYLQALEQRRLDALEPEALADLAGVFPALQSYAAAANGGGDRYRMHRSVRQLLEALAATKPLVLVLDDLHWADPGSLELLGSLIRRPPDAAVLVAIALRPRQLDERLGGALERAHGAGALTRVELGALSADEARELLGSAVTGAVAESLYAESSGNPFYLQQLARSPQATESRRGAPDAAGVSLAGVEVPSAVAAALRGELALLDDGDRRVIEGAAVAGDPFEPELAAAAAGVPEPEAIDALDELLRRDLVRPTEVPRRFRFRHPLVRGAVYEAAPAGWRLSAHERTAAALAARGAPATARAHHVERSARHGDTEAIEVLREAGWASMGRAPAAAARLFGAALRLLPDSAAPSERVQLLEPMAVAHVAAGWFVPAYEAMRESYELRSEDSLPERVRLVAALASLEHMLGRHDEAHARLTRTLDELPDKSSPEAVALMTEIGIDGFFRLDYPAMREFSRRARDAATELGDRILTATPAAVLAFADVLGGAIPEAEASLAVAADLVDGLGDEELARCRRATNNIACAELYLEHYDDAARHSERALAVARATGQGGFVPILFWTGMIRAATGRLEAAAEVHETAVEVARLSGHSQGLAWNLVGRSLTATSAGDTETALAAAQEAVDVVEDEDMSFPAMWVRAGLATALADAGDFRRTTELLLSGCGGEELPRVPPGWRPSLFEVLTRCALGLGDVAGARDAAERSVGAAARLGDTLRLPTVWANRAAAAVAWAEGDPSEAAELALNSARLAAEVKAPVEEATSRMLAGRALAQAGERERATEEFTSAARIFEDCGALPRRDAADRELGKLGRRVHRRTRAGKADGSGIETLTERELEVARLVVDRKTNAQIAAELFLSPKTVETHIRHLFQKLEVSSRVEVARVVERADRELSSLK